MNTMPPLDNLNHWTQDENEEMRTCGHPTAEDPICASRLWRLHDFVIHGWTIEESASSADAPSVVELPNDVERFAVAEGIVHYLTIAITLAQEHFSQLPTLRIERDPDCDERWVSLLVLVSGEIGEVLDLEDRYTEAFLREVPWPVREKIRLSYRFSDDEAA